MIRSSSGGIPRSRTARPPVASETQPGWAETKPDPENPKEQVRRWAVGTVNRMLALLRKVLNNSVRWGYIPHAPKVKLLPAPETDFDYLHREEAERFLSWSRENGPHDFPLYSAAIYTGARCGELYGLRWSDIDLDCGLITYRRSYDQALTKSKKVRRVRMNKQLSIVLKSWRNVCPKGELALVFPRADGTARARERPPIDFEGISPP
jgi:integrase